MQLGEDVLHGSSVEGAGRLAPYRWWRQWRCCWIFLVREVQLCEVSWSHQQCAHQETWCSWLAPCRIHDEKKVVGSVGLSVISPDIEMQVVLPQCQSLRLASICYLIIVAHNTYHCCVVHGLDSMIGVIFGRAAMVWTAVDWAQMPGECQCWV